VRLSDDPCRSAHMLRHIPIKLLGPGCRLPGALRDERGDCLIQAGVRLTVVDVARLRSLGKPYLCGAEDWPADFTHHLRDGLSESDLNTPVSQAADSQPADAEMAPLDSNETVISAKQFRRNLSESLLGGMCLPEDICDQDGVLLLAAGSQITPRFLQLLRERGIQALKLRPPQPEYETGPEAATREQPLAADGESTRDLQTPASRRLDEHLAGELEIQSPLRPVQVWRRPRLPIESLRTEAALGLEQHAATADTIQNICGRLVGEYPFEERLSAVEAQRSVRRFVEMAAHDYDLLPTILSMQESDDEYLFDHCVNVTLLSVSVAYQLGLNHRQIMEVGLGALLQDIGMLKVPASIRLANRPLTPSEFSLIRQHPLHTIELLEDLRGIPRTAKLIAYQVHERFDGTGYPRMRTGAQIHGYAKIVAAADAYSAMTHPRPHRPAILPYEAAKTILVEGSLSKFDISIIRALLDTISLFPIGSFVVLSDSNHAKILRANPGFHTRPVVEIVDAARNPTGEIIDLSKKTTLKVVRGGDMDQPASVSETAASGVGTVR